MSDNILEFPSQEELQQKTLEGMAKVVETVEKNRKEGQVLLEKQLGRMKDMREAARSDSALLEEAEVALNATLATVEALNQFCDMLKDDLIGMVQNLENAGMSSYSSAIHHEALMSVLLSKGTVSEEEVRAAAQTAHERMQAQMAASMKAPTQDPEQ